MVKTYIIDTNILLHSAESIFKFEEHRIIIPQPVLTEIDKKKTEQNDVGRNARAFSRYVDDLRTKGSLVSGVVVNDKGGTLSIGLYHDNMSRFLPYQDMTKIDNQILAYALSVPASRESETILVSNDTNMRITADVFGIKSERYRNDRVQQDELYTGVQILNVDQGTIDKAYTQKYLVLEDLQIEEPYPNECFIIRNSMNLKQTVLMRYKSNEKALKVLPSNMKTCDITPRNVEQQFLLDMLKDPEINLVSVQGKSGSGKTLMALTAAINAVMEQGLYTKIVLLKPIVSMDNAHDLGFLPGSFLEKMSPWLSSFVDNLDIIMSGYNTKDDTIPTKKKKSKKDDDISFEKQIGKTNPMEELMQHGIIEIGSLQHLRGRSLNSQFIILDEAQNCSRHAIKTIITRLGEGSKIVIMGDISQIDTPYLDQTNNGLTIVAEAMKQSDITSHITLKKTERSKLAELATEVL
jgi:PhoH-like ATPase